MAFIEGSKIPTELIGHYLFANYQVMTDSDIITLSINQPSKSLSQLFTTSRYQCVVFITAFNPLSQQKNLTENLINNERLQLALKQYTPQIIESRSTDPSEQWTTEESFLALGINLETSKKLGAQFNQNAIVWIGIDATPRLILLRQPQS